MTFDTIFGHEEALYIREIVRLALNEDKEDLTSQGIFAKNDMSVAKLISRQDTLVVGLPLIQIIFEILNEPSSSYTVEVKEGDFVVAESLVATLTGTTILLLKAERVILNFITRMSGIANMTNAYVQKLEGTGVKLLDTRKTLPGHRYLDKYAVRMAGGENHRMHLAHMLMIKNNHADAAGSITDAVHKLRAAYTPCPPLIVECRDEKEVREAVLVNPDRILLDNMDINSLANNLPRIPKNIQAEISGGVTINNIRELALSSTIRPADYISVGRITHSAPIADFSLRIQNIEN